MNSPEEQEWLQAAQRFDMEALAAIYDQYSPRLYAYAMRLLGDADKAEECVAETFARFLQALHAGHGPRQHLQAYLYRIAHNWITDRYRREPPPNLNIEIHPLSDPAPPLEEAAEAQWMRQRLRWALWQLTPEQRQAILLRFVEGLDNETVAAALQKPVGAVKALQHRALAALKRLLKPEVEHV
ncbi:RNA polymerase sigma factor [Thermanaerothrix daxensis]|uniref:RNA polymerase sigma factor n=1 Tax=Thermanaerothrix daxensis TaxID=869279 RepID=UPI0009FB4147|nr:RNA polymerase sigma factor [Thermanaerothrix daxensis]